MRSGRLNQSIMLWFGNHVLRLKQQDGLSMRWCQSRRWGFSSTSGHKRNKRVLLFNKKKIALYCWTFTAVNYVSFYLHFTERYRKGETWTLLRLSISCFILFFSLLGSCGLEGGNCRILPWTEQFSSNVLWTIVRSGSLVTGDGNNGVRGPLCCLTWLLMRGALSKQFSPSTLISYQEKRAWPGWTITQTLRTVPARIYRENRDVTVYLLCLKDPHQIINIYIYAISGIFQ